MQNFHVLPSFLQGRVYPARYPFQTILSSLNTSCSLTFLLCFLCLQHSCPHQSNSLWPWSPSSSTISFGKASPSFLFSLLLCISFSISCTTLCLVSLACLPQYIIGCLREETDSPSPSSVLYRFGTGQIHRVGLLNVWMVAWEWYLVSGSAEIRIQNLKFLAFKLFFFFFG